MKGIIAATFLEKRRQASFLGICVALAFAVVFMFPKDSGVMRPLIINPNTYVQANNATWIPVSVSFIMGFFLPLIGVAYLRDAIALDREHGVMNLMMTTRINRLKYAFGKFVSNLAFLFIFLLTVMLFTLLGSVLKFGISSLKITQFVMPFVIIVPGLCFVAALTLLTETLPGLKNWFGTTALLIFVAGLYASGTSYQIVPNRLQRIFNLSGSQYLVSNIKVAIAQTPGQSLRLLRVIGSTSDKYSGKTNLVFPTIHLSMTDILNMTVLIAVSFLLVVFAGLLVERRPLYRTNQIHFGHVNRRFSKLVKMPGYTQFRLLTSNTNGIWMIVILLIWLVSWSGDAAQTTQRNLPLLFLTAMPLFSNLGTVGKQTGVDGLLRTIPSGQLKARFRERRTGIILAISLILPILTKISLGPIVLLVIWSVQIVLLAQTIGLITGNPRATQMIMIVFFYLYLNGAPVLPLVGTGRLLATIIYTVLGILASLVMLGQLKIKF